MKQNRELGSPGRHLEVIQQGGQHQEPLARLVVPRAEWVAIAAGSVAAGLFVFGLTAVLVEELELQFFGSQDFIRLFNLNHELSVPATVSSLGLAACALLLALITAVRGALRAPFVWHWGLLALIFLYLAVDEGASLHEILHAILGDTSIAQGYFERTWVIFGIAGVALLGLAYVPFLRHLPRRYALGMIICGAMYTGGALGFEMLGANASEQGAAVSYHVFATLEEMLEISGIAAFLVVLWSYLRTLPWSLGSPGSAR